MSRCQHLHARAYLPSYLLLIGLHRFVPPIYWEFYNSVKQTYLVFKEIRKIRGWCIVMLTLCLFSANTALKRSYLTCLYHTRQPQRTLRLSNLLKVTWPTSLFNGENVAEYMTGWSASNPPFREWDAATYNPHIMTSSNHVLWHKFYCNFWLPVFFIYVFAYTK